jgi:hypothetical protein
VSRNRTTGASIGEPRALAYTSRIAYISYARVYHLLTPSTLTIDRVTSYRLLEYIHSAATIPHLVTLYYAFFFLPPTPSLRLILYPYNTAGAAKSSISISNLYTTIVRQYSLLATMLSLKSNLIPQPNLQRQLILEKFNLLTLALTPKGKPNSLKEL